MVDATKIALTDGIKFPKINEEIFSAGVHLCVVGSQNPICPSGAIVGSKAFLRQPFSFSQEL